MHNDIKLVQKLHMFRHKDCFDKGNYQKLVLQKFLCFQIKSMFFKKKCFESNPSFTIVRKHFMNFCDIKH